MFEVVGPPLPLPSPSPSCAEWFVGGVLLLGVVNAVVDIALSTAGVDGVRYDLWVGCSVQGGGRVPLLLGGTVPGKYKDLVEMIVVVAEVVVVREVVEMLVAVAMSVVAVAAGAEVGAVELLLAAVVVVMVRCMLLLLLPLLPSS